MSQGFDRTSRSGVELSTEHNRVHEGQMLYGYKLWTSVAGAAVKNLYIYCSSATFEAHARMLITTEAKATVTINRASVDPTSPTTPVTVYNRKYLSDETANAKTKIYEAVTAGTWFEVDKFLIPAGAGNFKVGGQTGNVNEIILEEGEWYRVTITNAATTQDIEFRMEFYEINDAATFDDDIGNSAL